MAWGIKFEKFEALKKELNEELLLVVWNPKRWWYIYMSAVERKKKSNKFLLRNTFNASVVYKIEILEHFTVENYV